MFGVQRAPRFVLSAAFVVACFLSQPSYAQLEPLLVNARTATVLANVSYIEKMEDRNFSSNVEADRILQAAARTHLQERYTFAKDENADIIIQFDENRFSKKISLTVLNPEDNNVLYKESRDLVLVNNDVNRLVEHFVLAVDRFREEQIRHREEQDRLREEQVEEQVRHREEQVFATSLPRKWRYERPCVGLLTRPDCQKVEIWARGEYVYKTLENSDGTRTTSCAASRSGKEWVGTCTHEWFREKSKIFQSRSWSSLHR